jgi:hypothetical protein
VSQETDAATKYLEAHDQACKWAKINRHVIATRLVEQLQAQCTHFLLDITHNNVVKLSKVKNLYRLSHAKISYSQAQKGCVYDSVPSATVFQTFGHAFVSLCCSLFPSPPAKSQIKLEQQPKLRLWAFGV